MLVAAYLIEAGILLVIAPWTPRLWDHNMLVSVIPGLGKAMGSLFVRGAVSGLGLITLLGGFRDLASLLFARPRTDVPSVDGRMP